MKKFLFLLVICLVSVTAFAQLTQEQSDKVGRAAQQAAKGQQLLMLAKTGQVAAFRKELLHSPYYALRTRDAHGNNILHLASSKEMFALIWNLLDETTRESLLSQKNSSGETPLMAHIMYGHEDIFLSYFPRTNVYSGLKKMSSAIQHQHIDNIVQIKKADLIKQCSCANQTMWQRANGLYHRALSNGYTAQEREKMKQVRDVIGEVAPFLKVRS